MGVSAACNLEQLCSIWQCKGDRRKERINANLYEMRHALSCFK